MKPEVGEKKKRKNFGGSGRSAGPARRKQTVLSDPSVRLRVEQVEDRGSDVGGDCLVTMVTRIRPAVGFCLLISKSEPDGGDITPQDSLNGSVWIVCRDPRSWTRVRGGGAESGVGGGLGSEPVLKGTC